MMKTYMKFFLIVSSAYALNGLTATASTQVTPELKAKVEASIKSCEQSYENTTNLKARFDKIKKPGLIASSKAKLAYKNLDLNKATFDSLLQDFTKFTNSKVELRVISDPHDLQSKLIAYTNTCARNAAGLAGFVEWAVTGEGKTALEASYKIWQNETREQMKK